MAWFTDLAGKAETLLNNLDEQTGVALRNNVPKRRDYTPPAENRTGSSKTRKSPSKMSSPLNETKSSSSPRRLLINSKLGDKDYKKEKQPKLRMKRAASPKKYVYDTCPETLVGDVIHNDYELRHRRFSLPTNKEIMHQQYVCSVETAQVENTMLKNELDILHKEVSQLLDRLLTTEDGNNVDSGKELAQATKKLVSVETANNKDQIDKLSLSAQFEELKLKVHELTVIEMEKQKEQSKELQMEIDLLKNRNKELEELVRQLNKDATEHETQQIRAEKDLKHAQTTIADLESNLEKSTGECRRLERDWEAYKLRVKSMLFAKDKEIKQLQEGLNLTEDTKILIEQLDVLKKEREDLSEMLAGIRGECSDRMRHVEELKMRHEASERVVAALRDALKDERTAKTRAEAQVAALSKDLKCIQQETNQTIVSLRTALRDKDSEISRLKEMTIQSTETSAINVADYDDQASIDNDKIQYLTQTLVQRQKKIDSLLADNNMLRIQMEKLESKYKMELSALRTQNSHAVVQLQDDGCSRRARLSRSFIRGLSLRLGPLFRYPVFRIFLLFYMLGLHFWVITVLLTSTPETTKVGRFKESLENAQPFQT